MNLTSKGPLFLRVSVPEGLDAALEGLTREVLRQQPRDIYWFAAQHFETLVRLRDMGAHNAGLSPSSTHGSEKAGIPQDLTDEVADVVGQPEKEPLDVTDIQNEDEVNLTEKPNESAPELNGTVKTEDGDAGKLTTVVTGTAAVVGAAATVAAVNINSTGKQELSEGSEVATQSGIASVSASPAPALSEADTADVTEDGDVKSPLSVKLEDEAVVVEAASRKSGTSWEAEENRSVSTPITQDTAKSKEEVLRELVPDDKLSTARSEDIPEQGSRPTSASQIVVNEDGGSKPTSATVDGTIPISASSVKEESVPEQKQDAEYMSPISKESSSRRSPSSTEQGTESQKDNRPFSVTASNKETSRPPSSVSPSKEKADTATNANEVTTVNSSPLTVRKNVDGPVSGNEGTEIPGNATVSVKEDKEEETMPAGSEADNTEVSETRPVAILIKEEGSRPVSAAELTKEEVSRPEVSIEDTVQVFEDRKSSRPVSALRGGEVIENVTAEDTEVSKGPAGKLLLKTDELEDDRIRLEILSTVITTVNSQETEGSRPVDVTESNKDGGTRQFSAAYSNKEEGNDATEDTKISQEPTGSPPPNADKLKVGESLPRNSAGDITENFKGTAGSRPVSATESTKGEERKSVDATESAKEVGRGPVNSGVSNAEVSENPIGSLPVNAIELTTDEGCRSSSAAEKMTVDEEKPVNIILSEKYEESSARPVAENENSDESAATKAISDSVQQEEIHPVRVEGPTKEVESRPESVFEDAKKKEIESVTLENIQASEDRSVSVTISTEKEVSRPVSAAVPTESTTRPASSIVQGFTVELGESKVLTNEGNRSDSSTAITKGGNYTVTDAETTKEVVKSSVTTAESTTEEKRSRPHSAVRFMQGEGNRPLGVPGVMKEEGGGTANVSESIKEEDSGPVISEGFSVEERLEPAKEESSGPGTALNATKEESRPDGPAESTTEGNRLVGLSGSTKDQDSRPTSIVEVDAGPTETSQSRQDSVSGSVIEEGNASASYSTVNVENSEEQTGTRSLSGSELTNEGYRPTSSAPVKESSGEEQTETEVGNENTEVAAQLIEDVQASNRRPVSAAIEEEIARTENQASNEALTANIQEETDNGKSVVEVENTSTTPSALPSDGAKFEVSKEAREEGGLSSSSVAEKTESVESLTDSAPARTDDIIPSLGATVSANQPGSDKETEVLVVEDKSIKDEEKPVTEDVGVEKPTKDETEELNTAATIIQATFRGYQTRQALSKTTEKDEVPPSVTSHDFLFGPPVQQLASHEETSVGKVSGSPQTGEKQPEGENELAELQKPQECDEIRETQDGASDGASDADSSLSTAATKIQAGVRGFLARRHVHNMKTSNSTTAPSIGDSQQSLGDSLTSQEVEDEGVHTSGSLETEIQKQHQITIDDETYQPQEETLKVGRTEVQNRLSLDSQLEEKAQKPSVARSAVSLQLDGLTNEDEDRRVWETLQQQELDDAAIKIQSNYRGYRMRRSLRREDAVQMPTTSTSSITASSDVIPDPIRHSGEFHDMMVLPPSPEEDATDASAQSHVVIASSMAQHADDDVKSPAGNQETDVTGSSQGGEAKMDESAEGTATDAATKIQASYRGFKTRQDIRAANTAASKIQAGFRGYKVRKQLRENTVDNKNGPRSQGSRPQSANQESEANEIPASDVEERSATKIQAGVRGYLVRKRRQTERNAAVKIQAGFRGYQARREVKARNQQQQNK